MQTAFRVTLIAIAATLTACTTAAPVERAREVPSPPAPATQTVRPAPAVIGATSRILVSGNTFWGRYVDQWSRSSSQGYAYPFSRLHELDRDQYDEWISGLECPTVPGVRISAAEQDRLLSFNCDPAYLAEASRWFSVFSLANNHTDNQGEGGLAATRRELREVGIDYFGDPDPHRLDRVCSVLAFRVQVTHSAGAPTKGHLPVGLCGFHGVFEIPPPAAIERLRRLAKVVPVLALPHSGLEYVARETGIKVDLYRSMIAAGADAVLGDHAHWVQNSEAYRGRPIVYSMGNFMFDQQGDAEVTRAAAIKIKLTVPDQEHLDDWLTLGERCGSTSDCSSLVEEAGIPELKVAFRFGVVGVSTADRVTHAATPAETAGILDRLDWPRTVEGLKPPYRGW